jgi:hypothetical protein
MMLGVGETEEQVMDALRGEFTQIGYVVSFAD